MQKGDPCDALNSSSGVASVSTTDFTTTDSRSTTAKHNVFVTDQFGRQSAAAMATPNRTVASGQPSVGQGVSGLTAGQSPVQRPAVSGSGTVHHLGHGGSTLRTGATPFANLQQGILAMSMQAGQKSVAVGAGAATRITTETKTMVAQTSKTVTTSTVASKLQQSPGPSPRKKIKVEEVPAASEEISANRKLILDEKLKNMRDLKENYIDHLTEFFFLQNGGNLMDYHMWKKRPTPQLVQFLKSGNLDSDDEDEFLQEKKINEEVKVLTSSGSNVPLATPVAISTTLPPSVVALSQQGNEIKKPAGGRHGMVYGRIRHHISPPQSGVSSFLTSSSPQTAAPGRNTSMTSTTVSMATSLTSPIHKSASDTKLLTMGSARFSTPASMSIKKSPPASPGRPRQNSSSFDGTTIKGITTQEAIVERAKQEAQVMHRVSELRKTGLWSARRLPKVQEPPRNKAHWDYLLEEMQWLAADFLQERKWKKAGARKLAKMVHKYFQDLEQKELRAEKEEGLKLKKIGSQMAKIVKEFWSNIEKVVQYKQQSRMDEKRQKALDLHLNFIVDQTEKYSTWLTEGLGQSSRSGSTVGSLNTTPSHSVAGDDEFEPQGGDTDDEETIDKDEEGIDESETRDEIEALQKESEVPLDELLESLPKEILEKPASVSSDIEEDADKSGEDVEFDGEADIDMDVEDSIAEQEKHEKKKDVDKELTELKDEGDMTIDELRDKYAAAYDSDFDMPEDSEGETDTDNEEDESVSDEEEDDDEEEVSIEGEEEPEVGLEYLMNPGDKDEEQQEQVQQQQQQPETKKVDEKDPRMQITDIAAEALSLQPKGYTLQTTEVKTPVPFLIKHSLREYQHVGLDWLATMYEKKLNGILADEMGLGKTIQTIALLAHLACEKGVWGPHLIVVPTSVMLNWEMELKKWCPAFKILTYYGSQKERKQKRTGWTKTNAFHICITSYKLVIQDHQSFRRKKWKYFILDEAQNIKNFKSQRWQTLLNFSSQRRLLLTGTPLQNSLMELWSLMHFLMPHVFQSHREFKEWFANPLTGMIEGSREYNESLIRRLHKVLRPFLLRRLKDDVEKQMPKKYEHVVMCHLSKRQRFLYDEFMSQSKTKETLASGHFMSVINILMQLRKVCNHPSLFDPRPIVSPFKMEGLVYNTASETVKAVQYDPFENIDLKSLYPSLADMERDLPAFIAHRVKKLQTPQKLIEEIDDWPPEVPRPKPGKLKTSAIRCVSPGVQSGRSSPLVQVRSGSPVTGLKVHSSTAAVSTSTLSTTSKPAAMSQTRTGVVSPSGSKAVTTQPPLQAKVVPQTALGTNVAASSVVSVQQTTASSQPITVQIQHTDQGTRLMIPPGYIQIVQTSSGQHLIASSAPTASTSSLVVNGPPVANTAVSSNTKTVVSSAVSQVKMSPAIQLPSSTGVIGAQKPVMRVSPLGSAESLKSTAVGNTTSVGLPSINTSKASVQTVTSIKDQRTASQISYLKARKEQKASLRKSEFFIEPLYERQQKQREEKLQFISRTNKMHCEVKPVYGEDLCDVVNIYRDAYNSKCSHKNSHSWNGTGWVHCSCVATCEKQRTNPNFYWNQTKGLSDIVHTPEQYLTELSDVLDRFVFVTPPVKAEPLQMHVSHPPPSQLMEDKWREYMLHRHVSPKAVNYHKISTKMTVQFPELRLIQYDCGKLQTMDILLRKLKSGDHRVLIFTQMTRMLDILEAFLNYHGHRYLRLDGTTRVEQRQLLMDRFNADKRIFCFILSTRSGGVGVNLTGADTVIFYDSDWNPTMDAQAQDRCHRIGQTRDVHIYRLISERTVEENILKKANQKRMLGDMAIEGGNFTTAFFKQQTLSELFSEPSGLGTLVKEKEDEEKRKREEKEQAAAAQKASSQKAEPSEQAVMAQFEKALMNTEDETDAIAAERALAEQKADLAEFDENIPWDEKEAEQRKEEEESRVEQELAMLEKELTPVERYAVTFMENMMEPLNAEELLIAEEDIESAKKDWELNRLKALKEEEERRLDLEEDEMLYTYSRDDAYQQVFLSDVDNETMPMWAPPTPPQDDNDMYIDETLLFLYEPTVMPETQLPPIYVRKERRKVKSESITTRKQKQRKEEQPRVPRSLFDRPTAQLLKLRREAKLQKFKQGQIKMYRPMAGLQPKPHMESAPDQPEWLIHEDWALLQTVQSLFDVPLNLMIVSPAHTPNWDMVADVVNSCSRVYRSPKQCRLRYENVIIPREEGRILYDINPRKQKKTKSLYKTKNNRPMKTSQIHGQDSNNGVTILYSLRFDSVKGISQKRPPTTRQTLVNPTLKNPKHASVLQENSISYDQPLTPMEVAEIRAQRIQREKKQSQQQQQQQAAAAAAQQAVTDQQQVVVSGTAIQRASPIATSAQVQSAGATIVAISTATAQPQLASLGTVASSATVLTVAGNPLTQGTIRPRTQLTVQEITAMANHANQVAAGQANTQVRAQLQPGTTAGTTVLTAAQRITTATTLATSVGTVQQQLQAKQTQYQILRNPSLFKQHTQLQQQARNLPKVSLTPDQLRQQQQLRQLKGQVIPGPKTVIAQQIVAQNKPGQARPTISHLSQPTRAITHEDLARLKLAQQKVQMSGQLTQGQAVAGGATSVAQIQHHPQTGQLQATQIIAQGSVQQLGQTVTTVTGSQGATLVKTVSSPAGSVTIPVSINVSMPQKSGVTKATLSQLHPSQLQLQQMQRLQQQRKLQQPLSTQKTVQGQKVGTAPILNANSIQIIQQQGRSFTVQQLTALMKQQPQGATIQQIIQTSQPFQTSQPTIIATVTQSQATPQLVTKVIGTTSAQQTSQIQTLGGAAAGGTSATASATPVVSLSNVPISSLNIGSLSAAQSSVTASIVKPATVTTVTGDNMTTVQIHPVTTITPSKLSGLGQNVLVQPVQQLTVPTSTVTQQGSLSASPAIQTVQQQSQSTGAVNSQSPMTVTVSPSMTMSSVLTPVTVAYTTTPAAQSSSLTPTTLSSQPITVSAQTVQQTVAAVLQPQIQQHQASSLPSSTATTVIQHQPTQQQPGITSQPQQLVQQIQQQQPGITSQPQQLVQQIQQQQQQQTAQQLSQIAQQQQQQQQTAQQLSQTAQQQQQQQSQQTAQQLAQTAQQQQQQQSQQTAQQLAQTAQQQQLAKSAPYAMRTRNQPKPH